MGPRPIACCCYFINFWITKGASVVSLLCPQFLPSSIVILLHVIEKGAQRELQCSCVQSSLPFVIIFKCRSLLSWHKALRKEFFGEDPKSTRFVTVKQILILKW